MLPHHLPATKSAADAVLYQYPLRLRELVLDAPQAPGVYVFHGYENQHPLYIGKSINLRARLLSHLRAPEEVRLLTQTRHISIIPTAGEISALLLEAQMIKQQQPLFNRRLRKTRDTCSLILQDNHLHIRLTKDVAYGLDDNIYGLFKNHRTAKDKILLLADEHRLCLGLLGIEKLTPDRGCFRAAIRKCAGACCAKESLHQHQQRLVQALQQYKVALWPYQGAIAVKESFGRLKQFHVLNHWHYHGSYKSERGLVNRSIEKPYLFDADMYKILVKPVLSEKADIIIL